jgi:hypothetical protein
MASKSRGATKSAQTPAVATAKAGHAQWEIAKKDVPLHLLIAPQRPFRGLHQDVVQALKPTLLPAWSGSYNMYVLEDKKGGEQLEVVDGNHRWTALVEMWRDGVIDGNYMVGVVIFGRDTPDAVLMEKADSVNTSNAIFQHMTLTDKLFFLRQVLVRMDEARLTLERKTIPAGLMFQPGTVWDISPAKIHEYLYQNKQDSSTQKLVGLFRSFFGPLDYNKGNIERAALNRPSTLWNQLHWLNERSATWWAHFRNCMASAMTSLNARSQSAAWKTLRIPSVDLETEVKAFHPKQLDAERACVAANKDVLKVTGLLVLNTVYPGVFMNDLYGQRSDSDYRPKFEYILHRAFAHFAATGKLATREQYLAYKDEVASEEAFSRYKLWEELEHMRKLRDNTLAGAIWCTAWAAEFPKPMLGCAWPACRRVGDDTKSAAVQECAVCAGSKKAAYHACLPCTSAAYDGRKPVFEASGTFIEESFCVCPTCFVHLSVRAGDNPQRYVWPQPVLVQDTAIATADCVRCWVGLGQCNVHTTHRGHPHFKNNAEETALDILPGTVQKLFGEAKGRAIFPHIAKHLGDMTAHAAQMDLLSIINEVQLAVVLGAKDVRGLWRAACHSDILRGEIKMGDLDKADAEQGEMHTELLHQDDHDVSGAVQEALDAEKQKKDEQTRKMKLYKLSLTRSVKQVLVPMKWQSYHPRRNAPDYQNAFDTMIFDPMYGVSEQPTQDDFAKIRDMLHAMTKPNAVALVFNNMMNFELWRKAIEQEPPDRDTAPWHCDPWPLIITRVVQRNRIPKTADLLKNRAEMCLVFRKAVKGEGGKKGKWKRQDGSMLLDQFARNVPEIIPPNSNVWENYVPPGTQEALHDDDGKRVRKLAEKSRSLCEKVLLRFCPIKEGPYPAGRVFDFYAGTGVFGVAAKTLGINYLGTEENARVCALGQMRLGAVQQVLDSEELRLACGKPQATLMTHLVPTAGMDAMMNYVSRTEEGCLPTVMVPRTSSRSYYRYGKRESKVLSTTMNDILGMRPDGKGAVHGPQCECVHDSADEKKITELGPSCQDFYIQDSKLKVEGILARDVTILLIRGKKRQPSGKAFSLPGSSVMASTSSCSRSAN